MSKPITLNIPHELGRTEARRRIDEGFGQLSSHLGGAAGALSKSWDGDTMRFSLQAMGQAVTGTVNIAERDVRLEVLLPGILGMIAGKLRGRLQKEGQILLDDKRKA